MKKYSSKRSIQILSHLLQQYGISNIVLSPGSRNAPLSIHFGENDFFKSYSIVDERSAAFVALGMAQSCGVPTAICCTSGSAAANYYPAVTEAFYQNIPLLILTADRPTEYIDIFDGQTIRQRELFQQHSYGDFQLLEDSDPDAHEHNWQTVRSAIELCLEKSGPVHINIPLSEPLYELTTELPVFPTIEPQTKKPFHELSSTLTAQWNTSRRILILVGSQAPNKDLEAQLAQLVKNHSAVVLSEVHSNLSHPKFFRHIDRYIYNFTPQEYALYAPDLLITVGQNVVSKKVKQFLRKSNISQHWHVDPYWHPDTYFALTERIKMAPELFFNKLLSTINLEPSPYFTLWDTLRTFKDALHENFTKNVEFSDLYLFRELAKSIPQDYVIHFSNSSAIRYAQLFEYPQKVYCNRGTSGIDGSTSTAMGFACKSAHPVLLITGDIGFFYDINGLWNNYIPPYTRIIIFNNSEGNIFKIIPGPDQANSNILDEFIATRHQLNAELLARHYGFGYVRVEEENSLERVLGSFFNPSEKPQILEVDTAEAPNAEILRSYFKTLG
ncbi:2-succinyl-5-enolpyruvyl-6-hydroxy-3-cyclohexene-1-carboxylic-acid synthase [Planobacterium oryzisoli]|uniref:2-succinyl-5-enolpyruvyl-6-hydroxy-3-cyclohexene-1-carboxylate synthase n=1 Tax=Planobacterium oryzisoli TaxID=2771435 RepID=A0A930YWA2_9FLAO|nr:2-succinyl-5-enolpyruvyl-6-hydroxy-3-cyclohexene-1-carboxylic-acid synthase [Planobacterium oryzisoli]MBF5027465.1 2-succinyl-5-enolpyruvyl-6-hydroxy-3-cyclohexene-1-carboxylic-acid synthase [Planobacterium oryzisoli]